MDYSLILITQSPGNRCYQPAAPLLTVDAAVAGSIPWPGGEYNWVGQAMITWGGEGREAKTLVLIWITTGESRYPVKDRDGYYAPVTYAVIHPAKKV